jgi:hypothetical protein
VTPRYNAREYLLDRHIAAGFIVLSPAAMRIGAVPVLTSTMLHSLVPAG